MHILFGTNMLPLYVLYDLCRWPTSLVSLFWIVFGFGDVSDAEVIVSNTCANSTETVCHEANYHILTQFIGQVLYASYHLIMATTLLNMLIAMMSNSLQDIQVSGLSMAWCLNVAACHESHDIGLCDNVCMDISMDLWCYYTSSAVAYGVRGRNGVSFPCDNFFQTKQLFSFSSGSYDPLKDKGNI